MKALIIIFFLVLLGPASFAIGDPQRCECGQFSTGIIVFWVNGHCCNGAVIGANVYFYEEESPGVWSMTGSEIMPNLEAQGQCCVMM